jgi:arylsulfatase A
MANIFPGWPPLHSSLRSVLSLLPAACLLITACGKDSETEAAASTPKRPNIIIILADDVGVGDIGCYDEATKVRTPRIDELAADGMRFTQAYAPGSVCSPTRYALLSGLYPCRGPLRDAPAKYTSPLAFDRDRLTLPRFLKQMGYRTAHLGKWHLGYGETGITNWAGEIKPGPLEVGFDYQLSLPTNHSDNFKTYVENHRLLWLKPEVTELPGKPSRDQLTRIRYDDEVDSTLTAKAIEFMTQNREHPFFIYLALVATHTHVTPHKDYRGTSEIGQLGDYLHELDAHVGEIMDALEKLDLAKDTLVVFASDNGGQKDDFRNAGRDLNLRDDSLNVAEKAKTAKTDARTKFGHRTNGDLRGYKGGNYEGGFRVPFIVRWPGQIPAASISDQVITLADTLATTAGLLETTLPPAAGGDSFDLSPVLLGQTGGKTIKRSIILQTGRGLLAYRQGDWKLVFLQKPAWEMTPVDLTGKTELYDLAEDPGEKIDRADEFPERVDSMKRQLLEYLREGRSRPMDASQTTALQN